MSDKSKVIFDRWFAPAFQAKIERPYVHIIFGARQTGKSTLVRSILPPETLEFDLSDPRERSRLLADAGEFIKACESLSKQGKPHFVFVDEAQSVPSVFDSVQFLYDKNKTRWRFILCGSSARKLRQTGSNLLPGRSLLHHLYPLTLPERPSEEPGPKGGGTALPFAWPKGSTPQRPFPTADLLTRLTYGDLPGVVTSDESDRADLLKSYTTIHLEEEIRREALVKDWGAFVRFLQLAAAEAGQLVNYTSISNESGISQPTVKSHYQLLEDMFIGFHVPAFTKSPRKNLLSTPRFYFFDLGVRHAASGILPSPDVVKANPGPYFEQWVGTELWKRLGYLGEGRLYHQRSRDGSEVDFVIEQKGRLTPIEVKWTDHPTSGDARHLLTFMDENKRHAPHGYIVCRVPRPLRIHEKVTAIPWFQL